MYCICIVNHAYELFSCVIFRGRDDPPGGGGGRRTGGVTLREEGLCMDQLKVNLEVANEEKLRLLKYPVQGDRDVGRKEAMRSALIRLVTRELDDQQSGSLSSPGIAVRFLFCLILE